MQKVNRVPQNRSMIKYAVRLQLGGRVFVCFLACLIPQVLPWLMRLIPSSFGIVRLLVADTMIYGVSVPMLGLSFVASALVTDPMGVRLAAYFLTLNRDVEHLPSPLSVCDCFGPGYLRLAGGMALRSVVVMAWTAVPLCVGALIPGAWSVLEIDGDSVLRISNWAYGFILLAVGLNLYRGLGYAMVPYVLADEPQAGPREALRRSVALTRGRLLELLLLELSFLGWALFVSVTFFIGAVYAYPYIEGTMAAYYLAFTKPTPGQADSADDAR